MTYYPVSNEGVYVKGTVATYIDGYAPPKDGPFPVSVGGRHGDATLVHVWPEDLLPAEMIEHPVPTFDFEPDWTVRPGATIRELMEEKGVNDRELARRLHRPPPALLDVLDGDGAITVELALDLEQHLGAKAQFWMNLETRHRLYLARKEREATPVE